MSIKEIITIVIIFIGAPLTGSMAACGYDRSGAIMVVVLLIGIWITSDDRDLFWE